MSNNNHYNIEISETLVKVQISSLSLINLKSQWYSFLQIYLLESLNFLKEQLTISAIFPDNSSVEKTKPCRFQNNWIPEEI